MLGENPKNKNPENKLKFAIDNFNFLQALGKIPLTPF